MMKISVERLPDEVYEKYGFNTPTEDMSTYVVPTVRQRLDYIEETWGSEYDHVEKKTVSGGLSLLWKKV